MEIFGKHIFGTCADQWLKLCKEKKREWILKYTSQTDEKIISEFINNAKISKDCHCLDCGKNKKDVTNGIQQEITTVTEPTDVGGDNGTDNTQRPKRIKKRKNQ